MDRQAFVYMDLPGGPVLVGRLWSKLRKGRENATFEYDRSWLERPDRFALEPALSLAPGPFHAGVEKVLFGSIGDSAPDRWGRALMRRAERMAAEEEGRAPRTLHEIDFLLGVDDTVRVGALRFSMSEGGPFVAEAGAARRLPPLVELPRLLSAAERVATSDDDYEDLRLLIAPGSSLGGARPKASVVDGDGALSIAKFPHRFDETDAVAWEAVALALAAKAGIAVTEWRLVPAGERSALLVRRFDRRDGKRIPFLSAMSMLGARGNEEHSYLDIAEALQRHGAEPRHDLKELWRRIVFTVLISNTDDHLLNHGFVYDGPAGWRLSPAYDLNPVPVDVKARVLATAIDPDDPSASVDLALDVAEHFGLAAPEAKAIAGEIGRAVSEWRAVAAELGINRAEIERMASAFEHEDADSVRLVA